MVLTSFFWLIKSPSLILLLHANAKTSASVKPPALSLITMRYRVEQLTILSCYKGTVHRTEIFLPISDLKITVGPRHVTMRFLSPIFVINHGVSSLWSSSLPLTALLSCCYLSYVPISSKTVPLQKKSKIVSSRVSIPLFCSYLCWPKRPATEANFCYEMQFKHDLPHSVGSIRT